MTEILTKTNNNQNYNVMSKIYIFTKQFSLTL